MCALGMACAVAKRVWQAEGCLDYRHEPSIPSKALSEMEVTAFFQSHGSKTLTKECH
jgi:hypothetical protein